MKNKKINYLLIPVVVMIWGYVAYSLITYGEEEEKIEPILINSIIDRQGGDKERKKLYLNYRDPFLKGIRTQRRVSPVKASVKNAEKTPERKIEWGEVVYNGYLQNKDDEKKIGLLKINGTNVLAVTGESTTDIIIREIRQDSILLEKEDVRQWFRKNTKTNK